jgi:hypothetical protein
VPLVLNLNPPNYMQWRTLFEVMFAKCGVTEHIIDPPHAAPTYWLQDDAHLVSWLYNRISLEIFGLVYQRNATAAEIWASIATLFLENAKHESSSLPRSFVASSRVHAPSSTTSPASRTAPTASPTWVSLSLIAIRY